MSLILPMDDDDFPLHEGFVELEELTSTNDQLLWKETARWIKFEEDVEENTNRWGKPHIPCLCFKSFQDVRTVFENGVFILDLMEDSIQGIAETVLHHLLEGGQLCQDDREAFLSVLLTPHRHQFQKKLSHNFTRRLSSIVPMSHSPSPQPRLRSQTRDPTTKFNDLASVVEEGESSESSDLPKLTISTKLSKSQSVAIKEGMQKDFLSFNSTSLNRHKSSIETKIPKNAEATTVLVGSHDDLSTTVGAFVRLARGCKLGNLAEVRIPVRFLFILLGPQNEVVNFHEIGRCAATLMSDKLFLESAYEAECQRDLLDAMDNFMGDSVIIPPGDWDRNVLSQTIPMLAHQTKQIAIRRRGAIGRKAQAKCKEPKIQDKKVVELEADTLTRTGRFCGGLIRDVKRRYPFYGSDITDSFNLRCLVATIFVYLACLAPAISFGGLLYEKTDAWMGAAEMIFATALSGVIFALFAGQPLIIIGPTGPLLIFEKNTFELCKSFDIEYLPWRAWVGIWVMVICFCIVAFEGCFLIRYFTRFTEEIFACLISLIFIYDGCSYIWEIYDRYPLVADTNSDHGGQEYHQPNTALFTTILLFGTFFVAHNLRKLRHSHFFGHAARRIISDFGVLIAIVAMVFLDMFAADIFTQKLEVPDGFAVTSPHKRGWFVNPMGEQESMSARNIFAALIPAILVSILIFMEVGFCNVILDKKDNKLKKGPGYNLDLFIVGLLVGLDSILGLPWMCATPVHTVSHFHALVVMSSNHAPGEHARLQEVKEQRVTNVIIHLLIGFTVLLSPVLRLIPVSVLFGVFIYLGVSSLSHIQLCERVKLLFVPTSHHPDKRYVRNVPTNKMHFFTIAQIICVCVLVAIKLTVLAPGFPFFIICLIPLRKVLERFYADRELEELDNEVEEGNDSDLDDFDLFHVPL